MVLADLMTGQASCQAADAEDEEDGEKTVAEYDAQLIENACDLVGITAKLMGPDFAGTFFTSFAKLLNRFLVCGTVLLSFRDRALLFVFFSFFVFCEHLCRWTTRVGFMLVSAEANHELESRA